MSADLVGRTAECGRIEGALSPFRGGTGTALVLRGPPGVGKSALLDWTVAQSTDCTVLRATGTLRDMHEPFSLLEALLQDDVPRVEATTAREQSRLAAQLGAGIGPVDRFKVALVLFGLLSSLAESKPVLVVVDDAQWADQSSLDALVLALPRLDDDAVAMLFAQRDGEPCALDRVDLPTLQISGLTPDAACELLKGRVEATVARQLAQHTAGNPLALLELAVGLGDDQRSGRAPLSPWLLDTPTVEAGFLHRTRSLPPAAQRVLEIASIDSAIEPSILLALTDLFAPGGDHIGFLTDRGLLQLDDDRRFFVFNHPLLRMAVYRTLETADRRALHGMLASMLRRDVDVNRRAWHLAGASDGPNETAAGELERAAEYSQHRGAYAVAAETFERSADLTSDAGGRTGRLLAAGDAYWLAGHVDRSARVLDLALTLAPDQSQRADVQLKRIAAQRTRSSSRMFDELTREAEATEAVDPDRAAMLYAQAVMAGMMGMRLEVTRRSAERALELLDLTSPMYSLALLLHALLTSLMGQRREALPVFRAFADMFDAVGPGPQFAGFAEYTALAMLAGDDFPAASRILDAMIDYARREQALGLLPLPLSARAELRWRSGSWAAALADATESFAIVDETEQYIERSHTLMILGKIRGGVGRFEEARALVGEALALARESESAGLRYMASSAFGFVELSAGDLTAARTHLIACRDYSSRYGDREPTIWPWRAELVEVATALGQPVLAQEISVRLDDDATLHGSKQAYASAARGRGLVAREEATMIEAFEEAFGHLDGSPLVFERARTQLLYGERLLQHRRDRDAHQQLARALDTFEQLGAHPWSARARAHFSPNEHAPRTTVFEQLTARELQIAVIVSTGKTSGEAATELFLSRRTVEHHLAAVYRKLRIRNRTELAGLFKEAPTAETPPENAPRDT